MQIPLKEFWYFLLMATATGLAFLKTLVFGAYLKPEMMGYYSIAITIAGYGTFMQLGLLNGLNRELPVCLGAKKEELYSELVGETTLVVIALQIFGVIIYYAILSIMAFKEPSVKGAFYFAGLITVSASFDQIVMLRLRAEQRILSFSILKLTNSLAIFIFGIVAIKYLGYEGAIMAMAAVQFASFIVVTKFFLRPATYSTFRFNDIYYLLRIGFPLMIAGVLANFQISMDRLFLIKNMHAAAIGIYQIGFLPLSFGIVLASIILQYLSPSLLYRYGQTSSLKTVFDASFKASMFTLVAMFLFFPAVFPISAFVVNQWLQDYRDSLMLIPIFYIGAIFTSANLVGVVINAANRQILGVYQAAVITTLTFLGYLVVGHYSMSIESYAYVNVTAQILSFLLNTGISFYLVISQGQGKLFKSAEAKYQAKRNI